MAIEFGEVPEYAIAPRTRSGSALSEDIAQVRERAGESAKLPTKFRTVTTAKNAAGQIQRGKRAGFREDPVGSWTAVVAPVAFDDTTDEPIDADGAYVWITFNKV